VADRVAERVADRLAAENQPMARRILIWTMVAAALAAVFAAYLNPHLVVDLAGRVWACF
jgi:hypothetical protein